jgi:hypothetical protein
LLGLSAIALVSAVKPAKAEKRFALAVCPAGSSLGLTSPSSSPANQLACFKSQSITLTSWVKQVVTNGVGVWLYNSGGSSSYTNMTKTADTPTCATGTPAATGQCP